MTVCPSCGAEVRCRCGKPSVAEAIAYMETHPGTTQREAAEMAGVTRQAMTKAVTKGNQLPNVTVDQQFKLDFPWSADRDNEPEIKAVIAAIKRCSPDQRAYLWVQVFPAFKPSTLERHHEDGRKEIVVVV